LERKIGHCFEGYTNVIKCVVVLLDAWIGNGPNDGTIKI
jgi:hypothetical protein